MRTLFTAALCACPSLLHGVPASAPISTERWRPRLTMNAADRSPRIVMPGPASFGVPSKFAMKTHLNTLYVTTQGAYLAKHGLTVQVRVEKKTLAQLPLHTLEGIVCFGRVGAHHFSWGPAQMPAFPSRS